MDIAAYCASLAKVCVNASEWVQRNKEIVHNEEEGVLKDLRRAGRLFRRCAKAAERKMCVGVFGPSQAGKSYLISALARDEQGALLARFGADVHDFLQEINPEGGKESTGLVTRFTVDDAAILPEGHPVQIRLLSETDLVKILANTYFADCEHKDEAASDIAQTLKMLEKRKTKETSHIDIDALEEVREYLFTNFRSKARVMTLERHFWDQALLLGPTLALEDRILLYALIWDEVPAMTKLLRTLLLALERLGHAEKAFCTKEALLPRAGSIIDVATLAGLEEEREEEELLSLVTLEGKKASLPRAVVTALTAELSIVMDARPDGFFTSTDLLDFPGYRSRYKIDFLRRELEKKGMLKELFLRGKVAYLFQRYCEDRELTSMLLCIGPSNQEVQDLPSVINDWVCATHGARASDRTNRPVALFLILTKFDMEFEQKKGAPSVASRFDNRLHASLLDFFGKQHDWPKEWDEAGAFRNIFFLRNPNFRFDAVLEYDSSGQEMGIRPEIAGAVEELKSAFLASALVKKHFTSPKRAWDAAMELNDGGISYIRDSLRPLCQTDLKKEQLRQNVAETCAKLTRRLSAFYQTNDREEKMKAKLLLVRTLLTRLGQLGLSKRLGLLLRRLGTTDTALYELYPEAFRRYVEQPEVGPQETVAEEPLDLDLTNFDLEAWNPFSKDNQKKDAEYAKSSKRDEATFFAEYIEASWISSLHAMAEDAVLQKYFQLKATEFSALVSELACAAVRFKLREKMIAAFQKVCAYVNIHKESIVWQEASIAANLINEYIAWLGFPPSLPQKERTVSLGRSSVVLFEPKPKVQGELQLSESSESFAEQYFHDWANALAALIIENVNFDGARTINVEENLKLGAMLEILKKPI